MATRSSILVTAMLSLVALASLVPDAPVAAKEPTLDGIDWRTDLDAARSEAARTGRPMLVVFR